jgi:hypothetical protein
MKIRVLSLLVVGLIATSCGERLQEVPVDKFVGTWELAGRGMFEGIQIKIENQDEKMVGRIIKLNDKKVINMFADSNDVWVDNIRRTSNYEFRMTEKKVARELFAMYGISTSQEFKAQFIDDNTIGLATDNSDPIKSTVIYKRIK